MSKVKYYFFAFVSFVLAFITGVAWLNNVYLLLQWNPNDGKGVTYFGFIKCLDWSAVDFSTVATFVPFMGFLLIGIGFIRLSREKGNISEYFPFFKIYNDFTGTLGLIGTVWGLVMIGFYKPETITMADLITCLQTALWSTLIALLWVYFVANPVRWMMHYCHKQVVGEVVGSDSDLATQFDILGCSASKSSQGLDQATTSMNNLGQMATTFHAELKETVVVLKEFRERSGVDSHSELKKNLDCLQSMMNGMQGLIKGFNDESLARQKILVKKEETLASYAAALEREKKAREGLEAVVEKATRKFEEAQRRANEAVASEKLFKARVKELFEQ